VSGSAAADAARLAEALAGLTGVEAWSARLGIGSHLTVDLGGRVEDRYTARGREVIRVAGEWRLWVQLAAWRLEDAAQVLVGCEDPRPVIAERIAILDGRRVTAVTVMPPGLETVFDFDGVRLLVFPIHSSLGVTPGEPGERTQWSLWRPQGDIVSVAPGSGETWTLKPSKARADNWPALDGPDAGLVDL
jgi:hypothetical protein